MVKRMIAMAICSAVLLGGCVGASMPLNLSEMSPEQIAAFAKIKEANAWCVVINSPYGRGVSTFVNMDKAVLPTGGKITIDEQCKVGVEIMQPTAK